MASFTFSPKNYFYIIGGILLSVAALVYAKGFLIPFSFSLLLAFILTPAVRWLERRKIPSILAIILVFAAVVSIIFGISFFFGSQIANIISDFQNFTENFQKILNQGINKFNNTFTFLPPIDQQFVQQQVFGYIQKSGGSLLSSTFSQTSYILANGFLVPVYVFLLLLYRKGIKKGITYFFSVEKRPIVEKILYEVQGIGKSYIIGLLTVMLILGVANSVMLLIIGVDYAIMFGIMAALLIIIPYIGTYLGAALPILYALVTMDGTSTLFILVGFIVIQTIEGNFLTPKIVGSNTSVNALTAFIALIAGGFVWGVAGMILSIPFIAMLKKVFRHITGLQPLALLMGEELYEDEIDFTQKPTTPEKPNQKQQLPGEISKSPKTHRFQRVKNIWKIWTGKDPKKK
ncbi:MAG: AI-2E family transporter [Flavobacteriaceae bacterium]|nr:AI-2E family transporter [Flavobacteriaceae bacterium]